SITVDALALLFEQVLSNRAPEVANTAELIGEYGGFAHLLGRRTAALHQMLASNDDATFAPIDFTSHYQRSLYQALRNLTGGVSNLLQKASFGGDVAELMQRLLDSRATLTRRFAEVTSERLGGQ